MNQFFYEAISNFLLILDEQIYTPITSAWNESYLLVSINDFIANILNCIFNLFHDYESYAPYFNYMNIQFIEGEIFAWIIIISLIVLMVKIIKLPISILDSINKSTRIK